MATIDDLNTKLANQSVEITSANARAAATQAALDAKDTATATALDTIGTAIDQNTAAIQQIGVKAPA